MMKVPGLLLCDGPSQDYIGTSELLHLSRCTWSDLTSMD